LAGLLGINFYLVEFINISNTVIHSLLPKFDEIARKSTLSAPFGAVNAEDVQIKPAGKD